jgi:phosphocarrier protein HPr
MSGDIIHTRQLTIINKKGLHARATAKFVLCAERFEADVTIKRGDETVGATSIMGILTLGASIGTTIVIAATGTEAIPALDALEALVADRFGEGE